MQDSSWQAAEADVEHIIAARHGDPFQVLGMHETAQGMVVRAFVPHAETLEVVDAKGGVVPAAVSGGAGADSAGNHAIGPDP